MSDSVDSCLDSGYGSVEEFPCLQPLRPKFRKKDVRMKTFENWVWKINATPRELVDAGFYYLGTGDLVTCFYCGGGLKNWETQDNPWYEHAKFYPLCEYVLRKQSVEYVRNICLEFPHIKRPKICNPSLSSSVESIRNLIFSSERKEELLKQTLDLFMLFDPHVMYVKSVGVAEERIRRAMKRQLEMYGTGFASHQDLIQSVFEQNRTSMN